MDRDTFRERVATLKGRLLAMGVVTKANPRHYPAGTPGGKGGQFAPAGAQGAAMIGAKHPRRDDNGDDVMITKPTSPVGGMAWSHPGKEAVFVPGGKAPEALNGVPLRSWTPPKDWNSVTGQNPKIEPGPLQVPPGMKAGAGVVIQEKDGRVWVVEPTNHFGGYQRTFPKGTVENGLSIQASAIKEAWEESGLKIQITGHLGDFQRTTSVARFYTARRVSGTPTDAGWESQSVRLIPKSKLRDHLKHEADRPIIDAFEDMQVAKALAESDEGRIAAAFDRLMKAFNPKQPRWPSGSPLGGQWKSYSSAGFALPPMIGSATNPQYKKKAEALHAAAESGDAESVKAFVRAMQAKNAGLAGKEKLTSHDKWNQALQQYAEDLKASMGAKVTTAASADAITGPMKLSDMTQIAAKPGGSSSGAIYQDKNGTKWLVKGYGNSDMAKSEVLAAKLYEAMGVNVPEMRTVDLGTAHKGGIGVASKLLEEPFGNISAGNAQHVALARKDFGAHAFLANWDAIGLTNDNTVVTHAGKAVMVDPGGALDYRATGGKKGAAFGNMVTELGTLRDPSINPSAAKFFGGMTNSQIAESAKVVADLPNATINKLVDTYGPGTAQEKAALAAKLIARKEHMAKVAESLAPAKELAAAAMAAPKAPVNPPATGGPPKPAFIAHTASIGNYYNGLADKAAAAHAAGDLAALEAMKTKKNGNPAWNPKTQNGKAMEDYHASLVADLKAAGGAAKPAAAAPSAPGKGLFSEWDNPKPFHAAIADPQTAKLSDGMKLAIVSGMVESHKATGTPLSGKQQSAAEALLASVSMQEKAIPLVDAMASLRGEKKMGPADAQAKGDAINAKMAAQFQAATGAPLTGNALSAAQAAATPTTGWTPVGNALGAAPNFAKAKLDPKNVNAPSHNKKVDTIEAFYKAGDAQAIAAMKFGSNTYGKQQQKLANDALAALGSTAQVQAPAISAKAPKAAAAPAVSTPKAPTFKPERLPDSPDFANWNGPGKGLSSNATVNESNQKLAGELKALAATGDVAKLQAAKFPEINKATGQPTGNMLPIAQHPSQHIKAYHKDLIANIDEQLNPLPKVRFSASVTEGSVYDSLSKQFPAVKAKAVGDAAKKVGRYVVLGQASGLKIDAEGMATLSVTNGKLDINALHESSWSGFKSLPAVQQQAIRDYTGGSYGSMNKSLAEGKPGTKAASALKGMQDGAVPLPKGMVLARAYSPSGSVASHVAQLKEGMVIQDPAMISTATKPGGWTGNVQMKIIVGEGVKGLYTSYGKGGHVISNHPNENEVILPPGTRFMVLKVQDAHKDAHGIWSGQKVVTVLALPSTKVH